MGSTGSLSSSNSDSDSDSDSNGTVSQAHSHRGSSKVCCSTAATMGHGLSPIFIAARACYGEGFDDSHAHIEPDTASPPAGHAPPSSRQQNLLGVCLTSATSEVALVRPPYTDPYIVATGSMLTSDALKRLVDEGQVSGVVLGGSGLFRADGQTHYGARKLISGLVNVVYENDWLPVVVETSHPRTPVWLCREGNNDPSSMLVNYIRRHAAPHRSATIMQGQVR